MTLWVFDWLPFLTGSCYGHKNSWLYPYPSQVEGSKVIFLLSLQVFQKFSRDWWKIAIFFWTKIAKSTFFQFFHNKSLLFCFKSEWRFSWGFFWGILCFCESKIGDFTNFAYFFFILTSVSSDTSWGQSMSLSDLNEVSNFSWRYQLSYETLFVDKNES